eukprot:gb/GECH01003618.1/.p1 GENE.gb/GECH01003618.1/~~gb/GECH01003618.1/.p1  ORF type:complete len:392 (+),score=80.63 gb/GECH01003618.1/:1-1176(+)
MYSNCSTFDSSPSSSTRDAFSTLPDHQRLLPPNSSSRALHRRNSDIAHSSLSNREIKANTTARPLFDDTCQPKSKPFALFKTDNEENEEREERVPLAPLDGWDSNKRPHTFSSPIFDPDADSPQRKRMRYEFPASPKPSKIRCNLFADENSDDNKENGNSSLFHMSNIGSPCTCKKNMAPRPAPLHIPEKRERTASTGGLPTPIFSPERKSKSPTPDSAPVTPITPCPDPLLPVMAFPYKKECPSISSDTLASLLNGEYDDQIEQYYIIDCRYPYEHEGGHIRGAFNLYQKSELKEFFMNSPKEGAVIIFHCEFSQKRGPKLFSELRQMDRDAHSDSYPELYYPNMFLLDRGYKQFYAKYKEFCEPQDYVKMLDQRYTAQCIEYRRNSKSN